MDFRFRNAHDALQQTEFITISMYKLKTFLNTNKNQDNDCFQIHTLALPLEAGNMQTSTCPGVHCGVA